MPPVASSVAGVPVAADPFKGPKFKALQAQWRQLLRESGFKDIEDEEGRLIDHKSPCHISRLIGFRAGIWEDVRAYYYWASDMARRGQFQDDRDRTIWILHSEGYSSRQIAQHVKLKQWWICKKINKIRMELRAQDAEEHLPQSKSQELKAA